jgi:hypothetical protein
MNFSVHKGAEKCLKVSGGFLGEHHAEQPKGVALIAS